MHVLYQLKDGNRHLHSSIYHVLLTQNYVDDILADHNSFINLFRLKEKIYSVAPLWWIDFKILSSRTIIYVILDLSTSLIYSDLSLT